MHRVLLLCAAVLTIQGFALQARALPRYAAQTGTQCGLCHVDPTGSNARNDYGRDVFGAHHLPRRETAGIPSPEFSAGDRFSVSVGADLRAAYLWMRRTGAAEPDLNSFFLMQADLNAAAELGRNFTVYLERGLTNFRAFGLLHTEDRSGWVKAGHFDMPFGTRLVNHTAYVRQLAGFDPRGNFFGVDTGVEAGLEVEDLQVVAAVANGRAGGDTESPFDPDGHRGFYARAEYILRARQPGLRVGVSGHFNRADTADGSDRVRRHAAAHLAASLGRIGYLGEFDLLRTAAGDDGPRSGVAAYNQLSFLVVRGVDLLAIYELVDRNTADDTPWVSRVSTGFEFVPVSGLQWRATLRHQFPESFGTGRWEAITYAHFYF